MTSQHTPISVKMKFRSGPMAVRAALAHILSELEPLNWPQEDVGTIEIVLAEALNNIVEHAYPDVEIAGPITIDCRTAFDGLYVRIVDDGVPMPGGEMPTATEADLEQDMFDLPEGGFGWFLIQRLARDVSYQREEEQNILDLHLPIAKAG